MDGCVIYRNLSSSIPTNTQILKATSTGQMNTILTFYEITDPPVESPLSDIPVALLRKAIAVLTKTGRAQMIEIADGEGVRFFPGAGK